MKKATSLNLLSLLEQRGLLLTVTKQVDPARDLAAADWTIFNRLGKAALFERIDGCAGWRVACHLLADRTAWAMAFDHSEADLLGTLRKRFAAPIPPSEVRHADAPVCAISAAVDLRTIPLPLRAEHDPAPQFTAIAVARDPRENKEVVALVQLQVAGKDQLALLDMPPRLAELHAAYATNGGAVPVTLSVGADPALYLAGALAMGRPRADLALAGGLRGGPLKVTTLNGIPTPAESEYVIVAEIAAAAAAPFVKISNLLGTYSAPQRMHLVRCNALYRRTSPIHWSISTGGVMSLATELLVWEHIQNIEGGLDVLDVRCLPCASATVVILKLRPRVQGQATTALLGSLSGAAYWLKLAIAVDEDIDSSSLRDVLWSVASRTHAEINVGMSAGARMLYADIASPLAEEEPSAERIGTRWFIDSTMPAVSQPDQRAAFERAVPKNFRSVSLADHESR